MVPATTGPLSSRFNLTPVPLPISGSTTLSGATGETGALAWPTHVERDRGIRRPLLIVVSVLAAGAAVLVAYLGLAGRARPAAPAPKALATAVRVYIQSSPSGAIVLDASRGSVLGVTPLDTTYARASGSLALILRLDGYEERALSIKLGEDSSTSVDLRPARAEAPQTRPEESANTAHNEPKPVPHKPSAIHKPARPPIDREEEWRVH